MDLSMVNQAAVSECVYDDRDERPVDGDFVLPDYCPDIAAVLKCSMTPMIQSRQLGGDRLAAEGVVQLRVLYLDEERHTIHVCEFSQPFSSTFILKNGAGNDPCCELSVRTDYVNCRATSPRRLDIHGAFSVHLRVVGASTVSLLAPPEEETLFVRRQTVPSTVPVASADKSFTISEVLDVGGRRPIQTLLRTFCCVQTEPPKLLPGKLVLKGLLRLKNVYLTEGEEGAIEQVSHEIPFSQLFDIEGLCDSWICCVDPEIIAREIHVTANQAGANMLLSVNIKINAAVRCYRTGEVEVLTDAYSSQYPLQQEKRRVDFVTMDAPTTTQHTIREKVELPPEDLAEILDIWCDAPAATLRREEKLDYVDGRLNMYMLARDRSGQVGYYERTATYSLPFEEEPAEWQIRLEPLQLDYVLTGGQLEVKVLLEVIRQSRRVQTLECLTSLTPEEANPYPASRAALKLYYAGEGESLWEVAKSCHTSMQAVMEENGLTADILDRDRMLLIPLCG